MIGEIVRMNAAPQAGIGLAGMSSEHRSSAVAAFAGTLLLSSVAWYAYGANAAAANHAYFLAAIGMTAGAALAAVTLWNRDENAIVWYVIAVAIVARALLFATPPVLSNDVYRYLWDGRLLVHGIDPYVVAPERVAPVLRGWLYAHIDWKTVPTLYPPLDLALFSLAALVDARDVWATKLVFLAGDLATIGLILAGLAQARLPRGRVVLYAWCPLAIVEFAQNGHEEAWAIAAVLAALVATRAGRPLPAAVALAAATLVKLYPLALVPVFFARGSRWAALLAGGLVLCAYVPFAVWHHDFFGFLHAFAFSYHFNRTLQALFGTVGSLVLFATAVAAATFGRLRGADLASLTIGVVLAYLLLSPNVYPWYVTIFPALVPFAGGAFARPWQPVTTGILGWTYLAPLAYANTFFVAVGSIADHALRGVEYAPLVLGALYAAFRALRPNARAAATTLLVVAAISLATDGAQAAPPPNASPAAVRGMTLFDARCAICHRPTPNSIVGPDLRDVVDRRSPENLAHHLATAVPGPHLSRREIADVAAYLNALHQRILP